MISIRLESASELIMCLKIIPGKKRGPLHKTFEGEMFG